MDACASNELWHPVPDLAAAANDFLNLQGYWTDRAAVLETALKATRALREEVAAARFVGELANLHVQRADWDGAVEMYIQSLAMTEELGDWHTSANQYVNLGTACVEIDRPEAAKPFFARAYAGYSRIGAPEAESAVHGLVRACGSIEAAWAYLESFSAEFSDGSDK